MTEKKMIEATLPYDSLIEVGSLRELTLFWESR